MKKYLSNIYTSMIAVVLVMQTSTVHAHSGHFHIMGDLHTHATEILLVAIVVSVCAYLFIKR